MLSTLSDLNGDERFEPSYLGHAEEVEQVRISDDECIVEAEALSFPCWSKCMIPARGEYSGRRGL